MILSRAEHSTSIVNMEFSEIYSEYFPRIYAYARCRTGSGAEAEDAASAVFQKACARFSQYDPARGNIAQWLFGIARNEVNSGLRRAAILKFIPLDLFQDSAPSPQGDEGLWGAEKDVSQLIMALKGLEARERDLITLKFYSEMNNREIAKISGLSESNVGTILYRCMAKLRKNLKGDAI